MWEGTAEVHKSLYSLWVWQQLCSPSVLRGTALCSLVLDSLFFGLHAAARLNLSAVQGVKVDSLHGVCLVISH
jgi:hypothetical protein